jgi:hypothetical protein
MEHQQIKNQYINYVNIKGRRPYTDFGFLKDTTIEEAVFQAHFGSCLAVEQAIWADWFDQTVEDITSEEIFAQYSVREKILALNFTFLEKLKAQRNFAQLTLQPLSNFRLGVDVLNYLEESFSAFISQMISEGTYSGEITARPLISQHYQKVLWFQFVLTLRFWVKDQSPNTENTDAFVEKSINFAFDLLARNIADSAFDFVKFWWQQKIK